MGRRIWKERVDHDSLSDIIGVLRFLFMKVLALEATWDWLFVARDKTSVIFNGVISTSLPL